MAPKLLLWGIAPLAILFVSWTPVGLLPGPGLDPSWAAGLALAAHNGITFGNHFVFTYGPLGFLRIPQVWFVDQGQATLAYALVTRLLLAGALFTSARRTFGGLVAFLVAVVVASVVDESLVEVVVFLIAGVVVLSAELSDRQTVLLSLGAGVVAGTELLIKQSIGISLAALTLVFVLSLPRRRLVHLVVAGTGFAATVLVLWEATGQQIGALPDYLLHMEWIVSGFAPAMRLEALGVGWQYVAAPLVLALGLWAAWQMAIWMTPRQRWGIVGAWCVFWFFAFKEGFVRHDIGHASEFFGASLGAYFAFRWRPGQRLVALAGAASLLVFALAAQGHSFGDDFAPARNVRAAITELKDTFSSGRRASLVAQGRAYVQAADPLDPQSLALLRGTTVAVYPWETALAWGYQLHWDPLPVIQSYSSYTSGLDRLDADALASNHAPQRIILESTGELDGRILSFDEGMTIRAILCRYKYMGAAARFAVLVRVPNRCSPPQLIGRVHARWGQQVTVPQARTSNSLVFVRIEGVQVGGLERLKSLLYKPGERDIELNGGTPHRLIEQTAADGLPLLLAPQLDFPAPFNLAVGATSIAISTPGGPGGDSDAITFEFYSEDVASR